MVTSDQPDGDDSGDGLRAEAPTTVLKTSTSRSGSRGESADRTRRLEAVPVDRPLIDRAGDALARQPKVLFVRFKRLEEDKRGVLAALAALAVFLLVVALLSG